MQNYSITKKVARTIPFEKNERVTISLPESLLAYLRETSEKNGTSVSYLIKFLLEKAK